jgi:hypothetical protein
MYADLEMLPSHVVFFRPKGGRGKKMLGFLNRLTQLGLADILVISREWGVPYQMTDVPYGVGEGCWWFHEPTPQAIAILENLGVEVPEENRRPKFEQTRTLPLPTPEFAEAAIVSAIEETREQKNGDHNPKSGANVGHKRKATAAT